ncbi:hypothetical protein RhiirB3_447968 [Rhizophagus irregularis]|nr:hypothetical protein RhiirB3_447968 [Rhizophagus irregularis]
MIIQAEGSIITDESIGDIEVGTTFSTWEDAEIKLNQYAKFSGFSLRRKCVEVDKDGVIQRRTFECSFSGKAVSNQVIDITHQRERVSKKIMCPWHINLTKPKSSTEIGITSIIGQHNHSMIPDIYLYASKYCRLSEVILERIEFYVTKGNMGSKQIYPLLVASFPDQYIHKRDLYNAIQKFKSPLTNRYGDAQNTINKLFELKDHEPGWIIYTRLDPFDNRLMDNTCQTNWFDMYLTLLVVIDNNTKSRLVAQCLSKDETTKNSALINAVSSKFPETHHYLYIFHI